MVFEKGQRAWNYNKHKFECPHCGIIQLVSPCYIKDKKTCGDKACRTIHFSKTRSGANNSMFGKEHSKELKEHWSLTKRKNGYIDSKGYRRFSRMGKNIFEHNLVWLKESEWGFIPEGFVIHHRNGNKLDNIIENLVCLPNEYHTEMHRSLSK